MRIPQELKDLNKWITWDFVEKNRVVTKEPRIVSKPNIRASSTDKETWTTFEKASKLERVGFVFSSDDEIMGIDIDFKPEFNEAYFKILAQDVIKKFNTYTEISPSGNGFHLYFKTSFIMEKGKNGGNEYSDRIKFEAYQSGRFFTVTGMHVKDTPLEVNTCDDAFEWFMGLYYPEKISQEQVDDRPSPKMSDEEIKKLLFSEKGGKGKALFNGEIGFGSESEADGSLSSKLVFYTHDVDQVDRIMRDSALYRKKWDRGDDYLKRFHIMTAIAKPHERYHLKDNGETFNSMAGIKEEEKSKYDYPSFNDLSLLAITEPELEPFESGYIKIDEALDGGFKMKNAYLVAGLQKSGKSSWLLKMLQYQLEKGIRVGFINSELSEKEFIINLTAYYFDKNRNDVTTEEMLDWRKKFGKSFEYVGVDLVGKASNTTIAGYINLMVSKGIKCLILDNMTTRANTSTNEGEGYKKIAELSQMIINKTKESNIVSFTVLHVKTSILIPVEKKTVELSRSIYQNQSSAYARRPTTHDIYGGGQIHSQFSGTIMIWRAFQEFSNDPISGFSAIMLTAMRHGKTQTIEYDFVAEKGLFQPVDNYVEEVNKELDKNSYRSKK